MKRARFFVFGTLTVLFGLVALWTTVGANGLPGPPLVSPLQRVIPKPAPFAIGLKRPLSSLAPLPPRTAGNTADSRARHRMSLSDATIDWATVSGCASTIGSIFNAGCQIQFRLVNNNPTINGDTFQEYYIDAAGSTAQTIGATHGGGTGPFHTLTLSNPGIYVLGSYDTTKNQWAAVMYVQVGNSALTIGAYADSGETTPATAFTIPSAGTTNVYIGVNGASQTDSYVVYVENTTYLATCVYMAPPITLPAGSNKGLCDTGAEASYINSPSGSISVTWPVSSTATPGSYTIVLWDQTTKQRVAQTQVALKGTSGSALPSTLAPVAGNASPAPAPAATPTTVFAFDTTTDQSDKGITATFAGVTSGHKLCLNVQDPEAHTFTANGFVCQTPASSTATFTYNFSASNSPVDYIGNTYTIAAHDDVTNTVVGAATFKILGYNMLTEFTDSSGTTILGQSQVLPKNSTIGGGLMFVNDGDSVYGSGNGDTISGIQFTTDGNGDVVILPCGACLSEVVSDSNGNQWNVALTNVGTGSNSGSILTITPVTPGVTLAMNASIALTNLIFSNSFGNANCTSTCPANTSILPADGLTWSTFGSTASSNLIYFTNNSSNTYAGTSNFIRVGITNAGTAYTGGAMADEEDRGYYPRFSNAIYSSTEPFSAGTSYADVYSMKVTNNSSTGTINGIAIGFPNALAVSGITPGVDLGSPSAWKSATCPTGFAVTTYCIVPNGANTGIGPGANQTIYIDLQGLPASTFLYTDVTIQAYSPDSFPLTPDSQLTPFVDGGSPATVDSTAISAFSLDSGFMTAAFAPASEGTGTNNAVQILVKNTSTASDPNPDYLDAVVIELPTGVVSATPAWSGISPATWMYLGSSTGLVGGTTDYWFGLCASQMNAADGPSLNPPPVKPALPNCGSSPEQNSLGAGGQFTATTNFNVGAAATTIQGTMYAHGANGDGWSKGKALTLTVTAVAANAGFINAGTYGAPPAVPTNTEPQVGADSSSTYGNSYVYQIHNTSNTTNITSAVITVPGTDNSGANGTDSAGVNWTITAAPTLSGSGWTHCAVTSYTSASTSGANGQIVIGNDSSGTCTITPGGSLDVSLSMKAPYKVNAEYKFAATENGAVAASEAWLGDTYVKIVVSGSIAITVWPSGAGPGGSNPVPACTLTCNANQATNTLDMGAIPNGSNNTGTDVVLVSVYTDAASPIGWKLYVTTNNNPANTSGPVDELLTGVDSAHSTSGAGLNFDQTAFAVIPTSSPGSLLVDTGTGSTARRLPFDVVNNYQVSISGGSLSPQISTITYTFISN